MHKSELIQLHTLLCQIKNKFETSYRDSIQENGNDEVENEDYDGNLFTEYKKVGIQPTHVHRSKADHKRAIFVLGKELAQVLSDEELSNSHRVARMLENFAYEAGKEGNFPPNDINHYKRRLGEIQSELKEEKSEREHLEEVVDSAVKNLEHYERKIDDLEEKLKAERKKSTKSTDSNLVKSHKQRAKRLKTELDSAKEEAREKEEEVRELKGLTERYESRIDTLTGAMEELQDEIEEAQHGSEEIERLQQELDKVRTIASTAEDRIEEIEEEKVDLKDQLRKYEDLGTPEELKVKLSSNGSSNGNHENGERIDKDETKTEKRRSVKQIKKNTIKRDILENVELGMPLAKLAEIVYIQQGREDDMEKAVHKTYIQINNIRNENHVKIKVNPDTKKVKMGKGIKIQTGIGRGNYKRNSASA